jgi:hypothetical protein
VFTLLTLFIGLPLAIWIAGALYYDVAGAAQQAWLLVAGWLAMVFGWLLFGPGGANGFFWLLVAEGLFFAWWLTIPAQQHREWDPNFSTPARFSCNGDLLTAEHVRNTEYQSLEESTPRYETRTYRLSNLRGIDALILYWGSPYMCHPMFVFDFGPDGRLCFSIEVRYGKGQEYDFLRSLYRQQELMYVVSDERDAILRRTKFLPNQQMYLYRINNDPLTLRAFFFEYLTQVNSLADVPRWYHGLTANCTTGIYLQSRARMKWDWRMLLNGQLDRLLYDRGVIDRSLPFDQLKAQSEVTAIANRTAAEGFSDTIRRELPAYARS